MVWGTDDNEVPEAWQLPARLLFAETEMDEKVLNLKVLDIVKRHWFGGCKSIVIVADGWHAEVIQKPKSSISRVSTEQMDVNRQE